MTQEQLISNLKAMADKDGVVSLKKDSNERYYLQKIVGKNDGTLMNEWVKENIGLVLYVKGKTDGEVILHRLRKNDLLRKEELAGKTVEVLYASDLIVSDSDKSVEGLLKNRIRKQIKEQAYAKQLSAEEYVSEYLGIKYHTKTKIQLRSFEDVDRWIKNNIRDDDANSLRKAKDFKIVRDWLRKNWQIKNSDVVSPFADYIISKHPEYSISAHSKFVNKSELLKSELIYYYPNKVIAGLKVDHNKLYHLIYSYRREVPNGHTMSMKQMIEDYIGNGELTYITDTTVRKSKYTLENIKAGMIQLFGKGDTNNPIVVKKYENGVVDKSKRKLLQAVRTFCKGNEISVEDFLRGEGYSQYSYVNQKATPAQKSSSSRHSSNKNSNTIKLRFGNKLSENGKGYEIVSRKR